MTKRLLLIGGGHSHAEVIRRFGIQPEPDVEITLVSPDRHTPYSGMLPGLVAGHYDFNQCHIDLQQVCHFHRVRWCPAMATALDTDTRLVHLDDGKQEPYDVVSIDTGSTPVLSAIPGANHYGVPVKPVKRFLEHWNALLEAIASRRAPARSITVIGAGAAGVEMILAMAYRIRSMQGHARLTLVGDTAVLLPSHPPGVRRPAMRKLAEYGVHMKLDTRVGEVSGGELRFDDGSSMTPDDIIWITGAAAPAWPSESGLQVDASGFIVVNRFLQSVSHSSVFAAGDIAGMEGCPRPKSGVFAVRQGPPLAENLRRALRGEVLLPYRPQQRALALISTGGKHAIASYGPWSISGDWVWQWKDRIDRGFMRRYSADPA